MCTDQEATQVTGGEFIFSPEPQGLACTGCRFSDDFHRWNNDINAAVAKPGLAPVEKAATLFLNIGYGPWQRCAWFHMICAQGARISKTLGANSKLLLRFWTRILLDRGVLRVDRDDLVGECARRDWVNTLVDLKLIYLKGVKVAPSKWMSLYTAGIAWDDTLTSRALVLASLCLSKGWILTEEDLFASTRLGATSCGDKPAPKSKAAGVRDAQAKLDALKQRQRNTLVSATKLICDVDVVNGFRMLLHAGRSQWTGFNALTSALTTPESCLKHWISWSQWGWLDSLIDCNDCLSDCTGLRRCGIETDFTKHQLAHMRPETAEVKYQNALSMRLHRLVDKILAHRSGSLVERCSYYPYKLVGLTSVELEVVKATLREFERDVKAWWAAKDLGFVPPVCFPTPSTSAPPPWMLQPCRTTVPIRSECLFSVSFTRHA